MLDVGVFGKIVAGLGLGLGLLWFIVRRLKAAEEDRMKLAARDAYLRGHIDAHRAEDEAERAAAEAAAKAGKDPTDWR